MVPGPGGGSSTSSDPGDNRGVIPDVPGDTSGVTGDIRAAPIFLRTDQEAPHTAG